MVSLYFSKIQNPAMEPTNDPVRSKQSINSKAASRSMGPGQPEEEARWGLHGLTPKDQPLMMKKWKCRGCCHFGWDSANLP